MLHPSYADLINVVNSGVEEGEDPVVNSRYSIVMATSKRARQIIAGDETLVDDRGKKALSVAVEELNQGKIKILGEEEKEEEAEAWKGSERLAGNEKENIVRIFGLRQESGRFGDDAGNACRAWIWIYRRRTRGRPGGSQYLLFYQWRQGGEHQYDPGDGGVKEKRCDWGVDRDRMSCTALPGRNPDRDSGGRCDSGYGGDRWDRENDREYLQGGEGESL